MKRTLAAIGSVVILGQLVWADTTDADKITRMFNACMPTNWMFASSLKPVPVRGLSNPIAQFTFTETTKTLGFGLSPGKTNTFHPTLILLAFPAAGAKEIAGAVEHNQARSDYPPLIFCLNDQYIFVTSPGYINNGLHTPEAENSLQDLKHALAKCTTIRYDIEPDGASNGSQPIRSETNSTPSATGSRR